MIRRKTVSRTSSTSSSNPIETKRVKTEAEENEEVASLSSELVGNTNPSISPITTKTKKNVGGTTTTKEDNEKKMKNNELQSYERKNDTHLLELMLEKEDKKDTKKEKKVKRSRRHSLIKQASFMDSERSERRGIVFSQSVDQLECSIIEPASLRRASQITSFRLYCMANSGYTNL